MDKFDRPRIVGFTGPMFSGKSTAAKVLYPDYVTLSFAEPLKAALVAMSLCTWEDFATDRKNRQIPWLPAGVTPRRLLQTLGTEWGRDIICKDIWVRVAMKKAQEKLAMDIDVVFDDVRFDEEAEMIRSMGGRIIKLNRESDRATMDHSSEFGINPILIDAIIDQSKKSTPESLKASIEQAFYSFETRFL